MSKKSCIVGQFLQIADLEGYEIRLLESLENDARSYPAGSLIRESGSEIVHFFTVHRGWTCAVHLLANGQRQVLDVCLPGQVMGLREIGFNRARSDYLCLTDVEACPFPRERLHEIFNRAPRLADLFFVVLSREQSMLTERIINIGRRPAIERLAHFFLEMKVRSRSRGDQFVLPMNQGVIGDALGISSVHVSRVLKHLREQYLVHVENQLVCINDLEGLIRVSGFDRTYLECDSNWARQY